MIHDRIRVEQALLFENTRSERRKTNEGETAATISRRQDHTHFDRRMRVASRRNEMRTRPAANQGQWIRIVKRLARQRYSSRVSMNARRLCKCRLALGRDGSER